MDLYVKQKLLSLKGRFDVYDKEENPVYTVEGKLLSLHSQHTIYSATGEQLALLRQKLLALLPTFSIQLSPEGTTYEMKGRLALAREVSVIKALDMEITGDFLQHNYRVTQRGQEVASVHQKWLAWGDTYEIHVEDGANPVLMVAIILCFDIMHATSRAASRSGS